MSLSLLTLDYQSIYFHWFVFRKSPTAKRKRIAKDADNDHMITLRHPIMFKDNNIEDEDDKNMDSRKNYYCKFCNKTWDFTHFKNSQQFGAHCSNCSRRTQQDGMVPMDDLPSPSSPSRPYVPSSSSPSSSSSSPSPSPSASPSYYEAIKTPKRFPPPFEDPGYNLILILRVMQEMDDFSDYEDETIPPPPPSHSHSSHSHSHSAHSLYHITHHPHSAHTHSHPHPPLIPTPTPVLWRRLFCICINSNIYFIQKTFFLFLPHPRRWLTRVESIILYRFFLLTPL